MIRLPPSSAHIWVPAGGCKGWARMVANAESKITNDNKEERLRGNAAHGLAQRKFEDSSLDLDSLIGNVYSESNPTVIDREMVDAVIEYVADCFAYMQESGDHFGAEEHVVYEAGIEGYVDFWNYDEHTRTLYVRDLKYGRTAVSAFRNWQLIIYASALMEKHSLEVNTVKLSIWQPRVYDSLGANREWSVSLGMFAQLELELDRAIRACRKEDVVTTTGSHCKRCSVRHGCKALRESVTTIMDSSSDDLVPANIEDNDLTYYYEAIERAEELVKNLKSGVEAQIEHSISEGNKVTGFEMRESYGRMTWKEGAEEQILNFATMAKVDVSKGVSLLTPRQAINAGFPEEWANLVTVKPKKGAKLKKTNIEQELQL